jgi:hypothetical protein
MCLQQRETGGAVTSHVIISSPVCFYFDVKERFDQEFYELSPRNLFFHVDGVVEVTFIEKTECGVLEAWRYVSIAHTAKSEED